MPEPQWLDRDLVDALHEQSLRLHGGLAGVRDDSVLEAAMASPRNFWAYEGDDDLFRLAAHLLVSLAKAHACSDGNQRIAIIAAVAFVGANGMALTIGAGELVPQTIRAARGQEQERAQEEEAIALWPQLSSRKRTASGAGRLSWRAPWAPQPAAAVAQGGLDRRRSPGAALPAHPLGSLEPAAGGHQW